MSVTLVTGASSGIGAATCRRLAAPGVRLLAHARGGKDGAKRAALDAVADACRAAGAEVETMLGDFEAEGAGAAAIAFCRERFGGLDRLVVNAGFADRAPIGEADRALLDRSLRVMTGAFFDLVTAAKPLLEASGTGRVVAVSSFVAHVFPRTHLFATTAAAKGGIEALAKALAVQLAASGTTVNVVAPGFTRKDATGHAALPPEAWKEAADMTPLGRIAEPDDVAAAIAFLLSKDARHITGQVLHVDGGLTLI